MDIFGLAIQNLTSPMVLFFLLGAVAAALRSNLSIPEAVAKGVSVYLIMAIGLKGGHEMAKAGLDTALLLSLVAGIILSFVIPFVAFACLSLSSKLPVVDRASIAAHYGSISIVTFLAGNEALKQLGYDPQGTMVAVAAAMEVPAILSGLWLAMQVGKSDDKKGAKVEINSELIRDVLFNGSILLLVGAFIIGALTNEQGMASIAPFVVDPFKGILCIFLLDMGLVAGRGLRDGWRELSAPVLGFGLYMPVIGAAFGLLTGWGLGLAIPETALFRILGASASYIAVPAAMRLALPEARAAIPLTLSLGVTFPFNLTIGIPIYVTLATALLGA